MTLNDVYVKYGLNSDIWNVEPKDLGFYCLYRHRPNDPDPPAPDCPDISKIALKHAEILTNAGFDYITIDVTNWPFVNTPTDVQVIRPTEILFEEWLKLRNQGTATPYISIWPCSPLNSDTWIALFSKVYNNPTYQDLIYKINGKKIVFLPDRPDCYNSEEEKKIQSNGGRNDVTTIRMWALDDPNRFTKGEWGFFSPCRSTPN